MIAIVDYGAGNLFSVKNALEYIGFAGQITRDADLLQAADGIILPGVGAFPDCMRMLGATGLIRPLQTAAEQKPFLGICLGMQMLFDQSTEFGETEGLGLIPGTVEPIVTPHKVPHMGWNALTYPKDRPQSLLLKGVEEGSSVYFVHSYMAYTSEENLAAYCDYGTNIPALVERGKVYGAQFHPEKSGQVGLTILRNFCELTQADKGADR